MPRKSSQEFNQPQKKKIYETSALPTVAEPRRTSRSTARQSNQKLQESLVAQADLRRRVKPATSLEQPGDQRLKPKASHKKKSTLRPTDKRDSKELTRKTRVKRKSSQRRAVNSKRKQPAVDKSPSGITQWIQDLPAEIPPSPNIRPERLRIGENLPNLRDISEPTESVFTVVSSMASEDRQTVRSQWSVAKFQTWLENRNVSIESDHQKHDWETTRILDGFLQFAESTSTSEDVGQLVELTKRFAQDFESHEHMHERSKELFDLVETFHHKLCNMLWEKGFGSINELDFDLDLQLAEIRNEAYFQRTIMMHSTDHWRLNDVFVCETEQQWSVPGEKGLWRLPMKDEMQLRANKTPQPDLAFYFRREAVQNGSSKMIPEPWFLAAYPCSNNRNDCFPFCIIEVKAPKGDMVLAQCDAFYAAAISLHNILKCMSAAHKTKIFYKSVRTFSIIANSTYFKAFIHRASWDENLQMIDFSWQLIRKEAFYSRNQISGIIRSILDIYGRETLLPILRETHQILCDTRAPKKVEDLGNAWKQFRKELERDEQRRSANQTRQPRKVAPKRSGDSTATHPPPPKFTRTINSTQRLSRSQANHSEAVVDDRPLTASFGISSLDVASQ